MSTDVMLATETRPQVERRSDGTAWQLFLIAAASSYTSLDTWVSNPEGPSLWTTLFAIAILVSAGLLAWWALSQFGLDSVGSAYGVAVFVFLFSISGPLLHALSIGRLGVILLVAIVATIVYRLQDMPPVRLTLTWGAFLLLLSPILTSLDHLGGAEPTISPVTTAEPLDLTHRPDVVMIVADGYGSPAVLEEFYGFDNSEFLDSLARLGFDIGQDVVTNYATTTLSVPSLLSLDYIVGESTLNPSDIEALFDILSGDNTLNVSLAASGYRTVYVESGWLGTQCTARIDVCIPGPWPDETLYDITNRSLFRGVPGFQTGISFSRGAVHTLEWLETNLQTYLADTVPDFIYAHLLAPHPPLFLDAECHQHPSNEMAGFAIGTPWRTQKELEATKAAYVNQVRCVNSVLEGVARWAVESNAILVLLADHGPDIGAQLFRSPYVWNEAQERERFGVMFAGYGPHCDFANLHSLVNIGRRIISCIGTMPLQDLPTRTYVYSIRESRVVAVSLRTETGEKIHAPLQPWSSKIGKPSVTLLMDRTV